MTHRHAEPPSPSTGDRHFGVLSPLTPGRLAGEDGDDLTPAQAFDALYASCAPALVRQTYLLTGRHDRARAAVDEAFQLAWQRWPEVAQDQDPAGWVRAVAHECALSPWHRLVPRNRAPGPPPDPADRALQQALLDLPPSHRRTLVLHDGVGLDLPETAAETGASTPAAANRLMHARETVAARLPELADPAELHRRLVRLGAAERLGTAGSAAVRTSGERRTRFWARSAVAFVVTVVGATALTLRTVPPHPPLPVSPERVVREVPSRGASGSLPPGASAPRAEPQEPQEPQDGPERPAPRAG